ncbi:AAAD deacetylase, partial [Atractosteus spatula]|nr:AAAD deacetylase [Atractosteus spatula]
MGSKGIILLLIGSLTAYYIYSPIPDEIEDKWKLMITDSFFRSLSHLADVLELVGLKDYMDVMMLITLAERVTPNADHDTTVAEALFDGVEVLVYEPRRESASAPRRAVIYLHGGGWCLGSARMAPYDLLSRRIASELNAVVVSVEYRLAPAHHFPVPFEDVYRAVKYFLAEDTVSRYSVDINRIAVSGDSAGGNLAAAVAQQLQLDKDVHAELKAQGLLYPVLQALDLNTPSYQQNEHMPILPKTLMVRFWSEYFTSDKSLFRSMMANSHNSLESSHLLRFVNWSTLLPEPFRRKYNYTALSADPSHATAALADPRASPLLAADAQLRALPRAYILTCEYDVLRDDGIMYATRLRDAGVQVRHEHYKGGFHGAMMFSVWPTDFKIAHRMLNNYIRWLDENL